MQNIIADRAKGMRSLVLVRALLFVSVVVDRKQTMNLVHEQNVSAFNHGPDVGAATVR